MKKPVSNMKSAWISISLVAASLILLGCAEETPPTVTPTPAPPIIVDIAMTANNVMAPVNIDFQAKNFTDGTTYFWDFGDGNSSSGTKARHTYLDAGSFNVRLTASRGEETVSDETTITVQPGDAGWLVLNAESLTIKGAEQFQFTAEAFDHLGNRIEAPSLTWHADPATGTIDENGLFTASKTIGFAPEGVRVGFARGNFTANYVVPVEVVHGPPTELQILPETIDTRVTWGVDLNAEVVDHVGHILEDVEIAWETLRPGDEIDQTGYYSPNETISAEDASLVLVTATLGDVTLEKIIKGSIGPGILDRLEVEGSLLELQSGDEVQLSAKAFDRFGHELQLDELMWEVDDPEVGTFNEEGLFTSGSFSGVFPENTVRVRGVKDGVETFTDIPISILPSEAIAIEFDDVDDSVPAGSSSPVGLRVLDENGNPINDVDVYLEVTSGGRLTPENAFKAGFEPGAYNGAIVARVLPGNAGNPEQLEASMDIEVRARSSDFLAVDIVGPRGAVIYLINLATGDLVPLSSEIESNEFIEDSPAWWPDGSRLAYSSDVNGKREIWDINPFTNDVRLLVSANNDVYMPDISPDGKSIAFVEIHDDGSSVYVADFEFDRNDELAEVITLEDARLLSDEPGVQQLFPRWSPDGNLVMFTSTPGDGRFRTMIVDVGDDFGDVVAVARSSSGFAWLPDGEHILVSTSQNIGGEQRNVLVIGDLTTGDIQEIDVGIANVGLSAISPDGSEISFIDEDTGFMWLMDIDGTGRRRALGSQYQTTVTAWRPQPLELPTPTDRDLGNSPLIVPTGNVNDDRVADQQHGTLGIYQVVIQTDRGNVRLDLFNHLAPVTVENFINLANAGYYDGLTFHTVEPESAVFGGSVINAFGGSAGYFIPSEFHPEALHDAPGTVSMVSKVVNGGSTEFVIALEPKPEWDAHVDGELKDCDDPNEICYAVFGRVIEGLDVLMGFEQIDRLSGSVTPHRIMKINVEHGS